MIKLRDLITELSPAGEEAKKRGLKGIGFGRYVNPSEPKKVVARTKDGKLVMVKGAKKKTAKKPAKKPEPDVLNPSQLTLPGIMPQKMVGQLGEVGLDAFNDENDPHGLIRNNSVRHEQTIIYAANILVGDSGHKSPRGYEESVTKYNELAGNWGGYGLPINVVLAIGKWRDKSSAAAKFSYEDGRRQAIEWRAKLNDSDLETISDVQMRWQSTGNWSRPEYERQENNQIINAVCSEKPPIMMVSPETGCIERGMKVPLEDVEDFLSNFTVGKNIVLPPGGFSSDLGVARPFSMVGRSESRVGVILRIKPKEGTNKMIGLQLVGSSYVIPRPPDREALEQDEPEVPDREELADQWEQAHPRPKKPIRKDFDTDAEYEYEMGRWVEEVEDWPHARNRYVNGWMDEAEEKHSEWEDEMLQLEGRWQSLEMGEYDYESEVIRPGTVQQKVLSVKKHVFPGSGGDRPGGSTAAKRHREVYGAMVFYEIEMEDAGEVPPEQYMEWLYGLETSLMVEKDGGLLKRVRDMLGRLVSTRIAQVVRKSPEEKTLGKYTSGRVVRKSR